MRKVSVASFVHGVDGGSDGGGPPQSQFHLNRLNCWVNHDVKYAHVFVDEGGAYDGCRCPVACPARRPLCRRANRGRDWRTGTSDTVSPHYHLSFNVYARELFHFRCRNQNSPDPAGWRHQ
ncbi:MAG: hypothetical protein BJ554DRAFT_4405 [Olpidium bornovanus]|uniref:Uncharacterized protein n=1 Tax=Olpidium bornovanus TaxID=278681 RepID=A0A8H8A0X6_9FUNG|nr:MAG: hypothetical protein BJ554DRAFT_4405 [Olpidium bornovanus]